MDSKAAEVTPENAQGLYAEGKITVNQARGAYGFPPFEGADGDIGSFRLMPAPRALFRDPAEGDA